MYTYRSGHGKKSIVQINSDKNSINKIITDRFDGFRLLFSHHSLHDQRIEGSKGRRGPTVHFFPSFAARQKGRRGPFFPIIRWHDKRVQQSIFSHSLQEGYNRVEGVQRSIFFTSFAARRKATKGSKGSNGQIFFHHSLQKVDERVLKGPMVNIFFHHSLQEGDERSDAPTDGDMDNNSEWWPFGGPAPAFAESKFIRWGADPRKLIAVGSTVGSPNPCSWKKIILFHFYTHLFFDEIFFYFLTEMVQFALQNPYF